MIRKDLKIFLKATRTRNSKHSQGINYCFDVSVKKTKIISAEFQMAQGILFSSHLIQTLFLFAFLFFGYLLDQGNSGDSRFGRTS